MSRRDAISVLLTNQSASASCHSSGALGTLGHGLAWSFETLHQGSGSNQKVFMSLVTLCWKQFVALPQLDEEGRDDRDAVGICEDIELNGGSAGAWHLGKCMTNLHFLQS
ncbi:hypothetical protein MRS44_017755 [Fusarium solani]|uniref:uncharacterized protein n=1 Tax=Fusarium solani TaxID=169388 RepID=UPI0032C40A7C|nr:hypothetical protein MRS44_017755 [Fusarium solani]